MFKLILPCFLLLAACSTPPLLTNQEQLLPEIQQQAYLSHAKPAQHFGFKVYPIENGEVGMRGAARLHPNQQAILPMAGKHLPVISIGGRNLNHPAYALLDTGSPTSWMEFSYAQKMNTDFLSFRERNFPYRGGYNTGNVPAYGAVVHQLRIDQLFIDNLPLFVRMATDSLGPQTRNIEAPPITTVLGYDCLQLFSAVQFDFLNTTIRLATSQPFTPNESWLISQVPIVKQPNVGLAIEGAIFGKTTPIVLDLAGDYTLANPTGDKTPARQLSFGDLVFRQVSQIPLPPNALPRVGRNLFVGLIVTICPQDGIVYFERPQ